MYSLEKTYSSAYSQKIEKKREVFNSKALQFIPLIMVISCVPFLQKWFTAKKLFKSPITLTFLTRIPSPGKTLKLHKSLRFKRTYSRAYSRNQDFGERVKDAY